MEKILTISIAAYQVEKYIEKNLKSLINSKVIDFLEIFVIDDGGKDSTVDIAEKYQRMYPDSIKIVRKENGGYGSTVNYSIAHATGKYFKLLDGDDWFNTKGLIMLVDYLKKCQSDIVITPVFKCYESGEIKKEGFPEYPKNKILRISELKNTSIFSMWAMAYRTDVLKKSKLILPEHMLYTDQYYATIPLAYAKTILFLPKGVYCYRIGRDGQSISKESRIKHIDETIKISKDLTEFCVSLRKKNNPNYDYISSRAAGVCSRAARTILLKEINSENLNLLKKYDKDIENISQDIFRKQAYMGQTGKFLNIMRKTNYMVYWALKMLPDGMPNWG